uniref:VWFA domain-containing protein n=1 Tax=Eutreptiella gymnastica TaxID=73025 RepID=A0A7S4CT52_9EUGL
MGLRDNATLRLYPPFDETHLDQLLRANNLGRHVDHLLQQGILNAQSEAELRQHVTVLEDLDDEDCNDLVAEVMREYPHVCMPARKALGAPLHQNPDTDDETENQNPGDVCPHAHDEVPYDSFGPQCGGPETAPFETRPDVARDAVPNDSFGAHCGGPETAPLETCRAAMHGASPQQVEEPDSQLPIGDHLDAAGVQQLINTISSARRETDQMRNKDIVVVVGNTGAGKTTLIHHLLGSALSIQERVVTGPDGKKHAHNVIDLVRALAPGSAIGAIGHESRSMTRQVSGQVLLNGLLLVDMPGEYDTANRGDVQSLIIQFHNALLKAFTLMLASSVRVVVVATESQLREKRGGALAAELEQALGLGKDPQTEDIATKSICLLLSQIVPNSELHKLTDPNMELQHLETMSTKLAMVIDAMQKEDPQGRYLFRGKIVKELYDEAQLTVQRSEKGDRSLKGLRVFVSNPLQDDQRRKELIEMLSTAPSITNPQATFAITFPEAVTRRLEKALAHLADDVRELLRAEQVDALAASTQVANILTLSEALCDDLNLSLFKPYRETLLKELQQISKASIGEITRALRTRQVADVKAQVQRAQKMDEFIQRLRHRRPDALEFWWLSRAALPDCVQVLRDFLAEIDLKRPPGDIVPELRQLFALERESAEQLWTGANLPKEDFPSQQKEFVKQLEEHVKQQAAAVKELVKPHEIAMKLTFLADAGVALQEFVPFGIADKHREAQQAVHHRLAAERDALVAMMQHWSGSDALSPPPEGQEGQEEQEAAQRSARFANLRLMTHSEELQAALGDDNLVEKYFAPVSNTDRLDRAVQELKEEADKEEADIEVLVAKLPKVLKLCTTLESSGDDETKASVAEKRAEIVDHIRQIRKQAGKHVAASISEHRKEWRAALRHVRCKMQTPATPVSRSVSVDEDCAAVSESVIAQIKRLAMLVAADEDLDGNIPTAGQCQRELQSALNTVTGLVDEMHGKIVSSSTTTPINEALVVTLECLHELQQIRIPEIPALNWRAEGVLRVFAANLAQKEKAFLQKIGEFVDATKADTTDDGWVRRMEDGIVTLHKLSQYSEKACTTKESELRSAADRKIREVQQEFDAAMTNEKFGDLLRVVHNDVVPLRHSKIVDWQKAGAKMEKAQRRKLEQLVKEAADADSLLVDPDRYYELYAFLQQISNAISELDALDDNLAKDDELLKDCCTVLAQMRGKINAQARAVVEEVTKRPVPAAAFENATKVESLPPPTRGACVRRMREEIIKLTKEIKAAVNTRTKLDDAAANIEAIYNGTCCEGVWALVAKQDDQNGREVQKSWDDLKDFLRKRSALANSELRKLLGAASQDLEDITEDARVLALMLSRATGDRKVLKSMCWVYSDHVHDLQKKCMPSGDETFPQHVTKLTEAIPQLATTESTIGNMLSGEFGNANQHLRSAIHQLDEWKKSLMARLTAMKDEVTKMASPPSNNFGEAERMMQDMRAILEKIAVEQCNVDVGAVRALCEFQVEGQTHASGVIDRWKFSYDASKLLAELKCSTQEGGRMLVDVLADYIKDQGRPVGAAECNTDVIVRVTKLQEFIDCTNQFLKELQTEPNKKKKLDADAQRQAEANQRILGSDAVLRVKDLKQFAEQFVSKNDRFCQDARQEIVQKLVSGLEHLDVNSDVAMLLDNFVKVNHLLPKATRDSVNEAVKHCANNVEGMASACQKAVRNRDLACLNLQEFEFLLRKMRTLTACNEQALKRVSPPIPTLQNIKDVVEKELQRINIREIEQQLEKLDYVPFFNNVAFLAEFENKFAVFFSCPKPPIAVVLKLLEKNAVHAKKEWEVGNYGAFDEAMMALVSIETATEQHQFLRTEIHKKAQERRGDVLLAVRKSLQRDFIGPASTAVTHVDFANRIIPLRRIANDAPVLNQVITPIIADLLDGFRTRVSADQMTQLSNYLIKGDETCRQIANDNEKHFAAALHERWVSRGQLSVQDCCDRLECDPPLTSNEKIRLQQKLEEYNSFMANEKKEFFNGAMSLDALYRQRLQSLQMEASKVKMSGSTDDLASLVNQVAAMFTLHHLMESSGSGYAMTPHVTQMIAIYRLLAIEKQTTTWRSVVNFVTGGKAIDAVRNHMIQILTGEGKSVTLGVLAAVFGLLDVGVDVVCYSEYLTERDADALEPFFAALKLPADTIRYLTFEKLCASRLEGVPAIAKELVEKAQLSNAARASIEPSKPRMLLIDEVDVFFSRRFYGELFNAGIALRSPNISRLVRLVYSKRGQAAFQVTETPEFKAMAADYHQKLLSILQSLAQQLVVNCNSTGKPLPEFDPVKRVVGYRPPGAGEVQWGVVFPNKTLFVYLQKEECGAISTDEVETHLCLDMMFGQFSYAEIPLNPRYYCGILGVTGTLRTQKAGQQAGHMILSQDERRIIKEEYRVKAMSFVPSVFGESKRNFEFNRDVYKHENLSDWMSAIEKDAHTAKKQGGVLVFFKNKGTLLEFRHARKDTLGPVSTLTHDTPSAERKGIITAATATGKITLFTRPYGRGVDFVTLTDDAVTTVIITFFSSAEAEEVQIMGRTARQGQKGNIIVHLAVPHLEEKFDVKSDALQAAKGSPGDAYREYLAEQRQWKGKKKTDGRAKRREAAEVADKQSWAIVRKITGDAPVTVKLDAIVKVASQNVSPPTHFILLLDKSYSMNGDRWAALHCSFNAFLDEARRVRADQDPQKTLVTVILFADRTHSLGTTTLQGTPSLSQRIPENSAGWGTNFTAAFEGAHDVLNGSADGSWDNKIVFLTDGEGGSPIATVRQLLQAHRQRISTYYSISFGSKDQRLLNEIAHEFVQNKVAAFTLDPKSRVELQEAFVAAVSSAPMHRL